MTFQKPSKKTVKKAIFIALIVAAGGWFVVRPMVFPPAPVLPTVSANVVEPQDVVSTLSTSGTIISGDTRSYFAPMNAKISAVGVEAGSSVSAGQLMVAFDQAQISREYERAKLNYDVSYYEYQQTMEDYEEIDEEVSSLNTKVTKARDKLEDAEEEADAARNDLSDARKKWMAAQSALQEATTLVNTKKAEIAELRTELEELQKDPITNAEAIKGQLEKITKAEDELAVLSQEQDIEGKQLAVNQAKLEMDDASAESDMAAAAEDAARSNLENARKSRSQEEKNQIDDLKEAQLDTTLSLSKLTLEEMAEQYAKAQQGIVSEIDGVVTKLEAVEGATAGEGMQLVTVASRDKVKVAVTLSRYDLEQVKLGQPAQVDFAGCTYGGRVSKIDETVLDTTVTNSNGTTTTQPTLTAEIEILNPDENIKLGLQADVTITTADKSQVLAVPVEAVITDLQGDFVWVVENGLAAKRYVTVGASSDVITEITSGLEGGELVVPTPSDDLAEGMAVQMAGTVPVTDPAQMSQQPADDASMGEPTAAGEEGSSAPEESQPEGGEPDASQPAEEASSPAADKGEEGQPAGDGSSVTQ